MTLATLLCATLVLIGFAIGWLACDAGHEAELERLRTEAARVMRDLGIDFLK